jgi:hypothetical protein
VSDDHSEWAKRQRHAAGAHAAREDVRRAAETAQARLIVVDFVRQATAKGLRTQRLDARPFSGRGTYRTQVHGWYVRRDHSLGIGTDGEFYVLSVPTSLRARLAGAHLTPSDPPLVAGKGARDGQAMDLAALLRQRLEAGDSFG